MSLYKYRVHSHSNDYNKLSCSFRGRIWAVSFFCYPLYGCCWIILKLQAYLSKQNKPLSSLVKGKIGDVLDSIVIEQISPVLIYFEMSEVRNTLLRAWPFSQGRHTETAMRTGLWPVSPKPQAAWGRLPNCWDTWLNVCFLARGHFVTWGTHTLGKLMTSP